jgi:hypothetical protein
MNQRFLSLCRVIAPVLFAFMTILGGAMMGRLVVDAGKRGWVLALYPEYAYNV